MTDVRVFGGGGYLQNILRCVSQRSVCGVRVGGGTEKGREGERKRQRPLRQGKGVRHTCCCLTFLWLKCSKMTVGEQKSEVKQRSSQTLRRGRLLKKEIVLGYQTQEEAGVGEAMVSKSKKALSPKRSFML